MGVVWSHQIDTCAHRGRGRTPVSSNSLDFSNFFLKKSISTSSPTPDSLDRLIAFCIVDVNVFFYITLNLERFSLHKRNLEKESFISYSKMVCNLERLDAQHRQDISCGYIAQW